MKQTETLADETQTKDEDTENHNVMPAPPPSKRQKKRLKKANISVRDKDKEIERMISYLIKWDTNRDEWKYEKLRQIYIQKNIFDESIIPTEHIDVATRYLATSKVNKNDFDMFVSLKVIEITINIIGTRSCYHNRSGRSNHQGN